MKWMHLTYLILHFNVDKVLKRIFSQNFQLPFLTRYQSKYVSSLLRAISLGNCMNFNTSFEFVGFIEIQYYFAKKVTELLRYFVSNAEKPLKVRLSDYQIIV